MKKQPLRIAFYGKGGIGKSTIAANLSAMFGKQGKRVLHIGCDPKADATRLLTEVRIPSVLQQLGEREHLKAEDMLFSGRHGVKCVEAGGPEAGRGCAGLGITTAVEELQYANVFEEPWDVILYDVLGDVVCGGFSVPMRKNFVDQVYVVTSSDYMALFAANNILKGIRHYSRSASLFGGLILNHVRQEAEISIAEVCARQTHTQLLTWFKEDSSIKCADFQKRLFADAFPETENSCRLRELMGKIEGAKEQELPVPLPQEEMERFGIQMAEAWYGKSKN